MNNLPPDPFSKEQGFSLGQLPPDELYVRGLRSNFFGPEGPVQLPGVNVSQLDIQLQEAEAALNALRTGDVGAQARLDGALTEIRSLFHLEEE